MEKSREQWAEGERARGAEVPLPAPPRPRRQLIRPAFRAVFQFVKYMVMLPVALVRGRRGKADEGTVYSAHPSFFLWLLIAVGFISAAVVTAKPHLAGTFGWLYVWVLVYFIVTLMYDFSARKLG